MTLVWLLTRFFVSRPQPILIYNPPYFILKENISSKPNLREFLNINHSKTRQQKLKFWKPLTNCALVANFSRSKKTAVIIIKKFSTVFDVGGSLELFIMASVDETRAFNGCRMGIDPTARERVREREMTEWLIIPRERQRERDTVSLASARVTYLRLRYTAAGRGNYLGSDSAAVCLSVCLSAWRGLVFGCFWISK